MSSHVYIYRVDHFFRVFGTTEKSAKFLLDQGPSQLRTRRNLDKLLDDLENNGVILQGRATITSCKVE